MFAGRLGKCLAFVLALAMAIDITTSQTTSTSLNTVEVDLVFPRNGTYAPDSLLPVIFAIQNPQSAEPFTFEVIWTIYDIDTHSDGLAGSSSDLTWANYSASGNNPYFVVSQTNALNGTEGHFSLTWELLASNCSVRASNIPLHDPKANLIKTTGTTLFTLKNGAQQPSMLTSKDSCPVNIAVFNVTDTLKIEYPSQFGRNTCAVLSETPPKPNPCAVKLDNVAASSISASVTALACASLYPVQMSGCPKSQWDESNTNTAARADLSLMRWSGVLMGLVLGIIFLVFHR